jgi:hypothetical protein
MRKGVDVWLGVMFNSSGANRKQGSAQAVAGASISHLERGRERGVKYAPYSCPEKKRTALKTDAFLYLST